MNNKWMAILRAALIFRVPARPNLSVDICTLFATIAGAALWKFELEQVRPREQLGLAALNRCRRRTSAGCARGARFWKQAMPCRFAPRKSISELE
jgi:hypothetical protein